jgi:hypothetical protein
MPTHRSHGHEHLEPPRHDELPAGVAAVRTTSEKRTAPHFEQGSAATKEAGAKGGSAHKGRTKLSHVIEGEKLTEQSRRRARVLRKALVTEIASTVGGGHCGILASLLAKFAAQKTAAAEEAFERGEYEAHRKLSESARMDGLYAKEAAAKEAAARAAQAPADALAARRARLLNKTTTTQ